MGYSPICPRCGYDNRGVQNIPYALRPGTLLNGKYVVGNVLGQGGFGITYVGFDRILEVKVAIKEYYVSGVSTRTGATQKVYWMKNPGDMSHFITEGRRMARLDRMPEIARVRDIFYENQTAYIVMDYVEGETLTSYLKRTGPMPYGQAVTLLLPVIDALARVHSQGIVHRDISPDNLMMEPQGTLRLLDLGAAGDLTRNNGQVSQLVARRGFSPYEQYMEGATMGPATDVYALCATLYYCCTGSMLPDALQRMDGFLRTKKSELTLDRGIPAKGARVLQKGLALEAKDRIGNMTDLADQLRKTLKGRAPKNRRFQKTLLAGAAAIAVIFAAAALLPGLGGQKTASAMAAAAETGPTEPARYALGEDTMPIGTVAVETEAEDAGEEVLRKAGGRGGASQSTWVRKELRIPQELELLDAEIEDTAVIEVLSGQQAGEILWSSDNPGVVQVSRNGTLTVAGAGTAKITASYWEERAVCTVTVRLKD